MKNEEFCDIMRQDERKNRSKTGKGNKTMGFFANLFKKKEVKVSETVQEVFAQNPECLKLMELRKYRLL